MNSHQLEKHMRKVIARLENKEALFGGVIPADFLKYQNPTLHKCFIVNTDDSRKPGQHWIAIFVRNATTVEYFDSYGRGPFEHIQWVRWMHNNFDHLWYNVKPVQSIMSAACGAHCLFYLYHRLHGHSMCEIINEMYHEIRDYNDLIVGIDLKKHLKADIVVDESIMERLISQKSQILE